METASVRLKEGKAREASDALGLALIYKPGDTAALAGRSHAMFMAGEYTSSALFLVRALDACPDYVKIPVDLADLAGGQAAVQAKIEEVGAYLRQEASPELRLILAYACYRTGDLGSARRTLDAGGVIDGPLGRALHVLGKALDEAQNPIGR
jgi:predicted Zn-dependent protease